MNVRPKSTRSHAPRGNASRDALRRSPSADKLPVRIAAERRAVRSHAERGNEVLCLAALLLLTLTGCSARIADQSADPPASVPAESVSVKTVAPVRQTLAYTIEQPGQLEPFERTPLHAKIPGYVKKVHVDIGDRVKGPRFDQQGKEVEPGQVLAELWVPELDEELAQKKAEALLAAAQVKQAEAAVKAAHSRIETAQAQVAEAEAGRARTRAERLRWTSEHVRVASLVKDRAVDERLLDESLQRRQAAEAACDECEARIKSAQAMVAESQARRDQADADLGAARARSDVAQADVRRVAALLEYATIRAPFDGVVDERHVDTRHFLQPDKSTKALFVVVRNDPVRVFVDVPERDAARIGDGAVARIRIPALDDAVIERPVTRTAGSLHDKTRTLRTEIDLPNGDGRLRPGMYAVASIEVKRDGQHALPASAVAVQGSETFCYLVEDGKAVRTRVRTGMRAGSLVAVRQRHDRQGKWVDWSGQEAVIAHIPHELRDGQAVRQAAE